MRLLLSARVEWVKERGVVWGWGAVVVSCGSSGCAGRVGEVLGCLGEFVLVWGVGAGVGWGLFANVSAGIKVVLDVQQFSNKIKIDNGIDDHQVNTASPQVSTGSREISTAAPEVNTATSEGLMGPIPTTEDTQGYWYKNGVYRNKKDERDSLQEQSKTCAQGHTHEEGIDYDEYLLPVARMGGYKEYFWLMLRIWVLLSSNGCQIGSSYMVKLKRGVCMSKPQGWRTDHPVKVYKVVKCTIWTSSAPRAWMDIFLDLPEGVSVKKFEKLMKDKFQMSIIVHEILKKFKYTDVKSAFTPTDLEKPLVKDGDADDVDEHLYRSMIGSLMYLTASRPDIMFVVCACARFQVSQKLTIA
ncbi:putative ribonuclease H-like domain-containing protein [Tanacetum coccineum]